MKVWIFLYVHTCAFSVQQLWWGSSKHESSFCLVHCQPSPLRDQ